MTDIEYTWQMRPAGSTGEKGGVYVPNHIGGEGRPDDRYASPWPAGLPVSWAEMGLPIGRCQIRSITRFVGEIEWMVSSETKSKYKEIEVFDESAKPPDEWNQEALRTVVTEQRNDSSLWDEPHTEFELRLRNALHRIHQCIWGEPDA